MFQLEWIVVYIILVTVLPISLYQLWLWSSRRKLQTSLPAEREQRNFSWMIIMASIIVDIGIIIAYSMVK